MCLYSDLLETKKHSKITTNKKFTFYKDFEIYYSMGNKIRTSYVGAPISYTLDFIEAKDALELDCGKIEGGAIHAYQNKKKEDSLYVKDIRVPIIVYADDIIAFGKKGDVCFFRYKISKKVWNWIEKILDKYKKFSDKEPIARIYPSTLLFYSYY